MTSFSFESMRIGGVFVSAVSVLILIELIISISRPAFISPAVTDKYHFGPPAEATKKSHAKHNANDYNLGVHNTTINSDVTASSSPSPYAYAFVVGGCNPQDPTYTGYLYNILIAARVLRKRGSQADIVAFIQIAYKSPDDKLPEAHANMLQKLDVRIRYIAKSATESFYEAQLEKFRILDMVEYRRVLFLDADVLPVGNMDYLFELSDGDNPILRENLVIAGPFEPANGGIFMLKPGAGEFEELNSIVRKREIRDKHLEGRKFDIVEGWGHPIKSPDYWQTTKISPRTNWTFNAAQADQGLLYHWVKYVKKSVSLVRSNIIENWSVDSNGTLRITATHDDPFVNVSRPTKVFHHECMRWCHNGCYAPYRDWVHFTGKKKPWLSDKPPLNLTAETGLTTRRMFWWYTLKQLNDEAKLGLDFDKWLVIGKPSLGFFPTTKDLNSRVETHRIIVD
jgi:hypothetical protein